MALETQIQLLTEAVQRLNDNIQNLIAAEIITSSEPAPVKVGLIPQLSSPAQVPPEVAITTRPDVAEKPQVETTITAAPAETITADQLLSLAKDYGQAKGRPAVVEVLARFGVSRLPELKPEQYAAAAEAFSLAEVAA